MTPPDAVMHPAENKDESGVPDPFSDKWKFLLGGGAINGPRYPGSRRGSISDDVGGHHEGVLASLAVEAKYHVTQRLTLSIGPEVTWVNNQYAMTFFGLDAAQSTIAGIAPYRAGSGINSVGVSAGASYMLTDHWSLAAHASYGRLQGDAANSPVTTDKTQRVYGGFVMYRF
jgi:outer membrane protein